MKYFTIYIRTGVISTRFIKKKKKIIWYYEFRVNMRDNLQTVHKELTLRVERNSLFFDQSVQSILVSGFT